MKIAIVSAFLLAGATAHAETDTPRPAKGTYSFDIGSQVRWFGDTSAAIVTTEALAGVRMTVGRSLTATSIRSRELDIGVFGRWAYGGTGGTMFGDLDTSIGQHLLGGGARVDAPLARWFSVIAQAELGMARTSLTVSRAEMTPVDDHAWAPYAQASLGGELVFARGDRVRASLGVDIGYLVAVPVEMHATPADRPAEDLSIATSFASLGKLDTRGFTYALYLRGRF
jgi:hypothetical protein